MKRKRRGFQWCTFLDALCHDSNHFSPARESKNVRGNTTATTAAPQQAAWLDAGLKPASLVLITSHFVLGREERDCMLLEVRKEWHMCKHSEH